MCGDAIERNGRPDGAAVRFFVSKCGAGSREACGRRADGQEGANVIAQVLVLIVFPATLLAAAGWDLASYTIPNRLQLALLVSFALFAVTVRMPPDVLGSHLLAGGTALLAGFVLFALGYIGGGDAKLFGCAALMFGMHDAAQYGLIASIFGGALTLGLLAMRSVPLPSFLTGMPWLLRLHDEREGVPYGVALAAAAFVQLPHAEIFRLAAAA